MSVQSARSLTATVMTDPTARFRQFDETYDLKCEHGARIYYTICATQRCGSHFLGHLMYSTGQMGYPLEYLYAPHLARWTDLSGRTETQEVFDYIKSRRTSPNGCFGFKMHYPQLIDAISKYALDVIFPGCRFILIEREDLLGQAISLVRALQTNQWISLHDRTGSASYDFDAIQRGISFILEEKASWRRFFAISGRDYFRVTYESLLENPPRAIDQIAEYLGVGPARIQWESVLPQRQADDESKRWRRQFLLDAAVLPGANVCKRISMTLTDAES
jgi:LPS sulfotransferase NodH